jgi:hypothetical protein
MIDRRVFVAGTLGLLTVPLAAEAQQTGKVHRIGYLGGFSVDQMLRSWMGSATTAMALLAGR